VPTPEVAHVQPGFVDVNNVLGFVIYFKELQSKLLS